MNSIKVEFQAVPEGASQYQAVAHLVVHADGRYELNDPEEYLSLEMPVPVRDEAGALRSVKFAEEPQLWARHLPSALRTGYLVPVVSELPAADPA